MDQKIALDRTKISPNSSKIEGVQTFHGIILTTTRYGESDLILQVMTQELGRISVLAKGGTSPKRFYGHLPTPLVQGEFVCKRRQSALWSLQALTLTHHFLGLRTSYAHLHAALDLSKLLIDSQYPEKPAPALFALLHWALTQLAAGAPSAVMQCAFRLKVLKHDGYLPLPIPFGSLEQRPWIEKLASERSCTTWDTIPQPEMLLETVKHFFSSQLLS